jgi:hypothetical protein
VVCGFGLYHRMTAVPSFPIPTPKLPSPNAHDMYLEASQSLVQTEKFKEPFSPATSKLPLTERNIIVQANATNLMLFETGMKHSYVHPPIRRMADDQSEYTSFRELARLLVFDGNIRADQGNWGSATNRYLDAMQLGHDIPKGSPLVGGLVGYACEAIGQRAAWAAAKKVNAQQARAAVRRLEAMEAKRVPLADILQEEKWSLQASLRGPIAQIVSRLTEDTDKNTNAFRFGILALKAQPLIFGKREILQSNADYLDTMSAAYRKPYASHPPSPPLPRDLLNQILLPVFFKSRIREVDTQTRHAMLTTAFALRAYRLEKGAYPSALGELVKAGILKQVPDDPFALSGPLSYRRTASDKYLLYSVGPDGQDDKGKPINSKTPEGKPKLWAEEGMIGDYVVGINTY